METSTQELNVGDKVTWAQFSAAEKHLETKWHRDYGTGPFWVVRTEMVGDQPQCDLARTPGGPTILFRFTQARFVLAA